MARTCQVQPKWRILTDAEWNDSRVYMQKCSGNEGTEISKRG